MEESNAWQHQTFRVLLVSSDLDQHRQFHKVAGQEKIFLECVCLVSEAQRATESQSYDSVVLSADILKYDVQLILDQLSPLQPNAQFVVMTTARTPRLPQDINLQILEGPTTDEDTRQFISKIRHLAELESSNRTRTILLIEDNPGDADLVKAYLDGRFKEHEDNIIHTETLEEGIRRLKDTPIDIVISDLTLPDAVNLDSVKRLRTSAPEAAILVLTGADPGKNGLRALEMGAQDFLIKSELNSTKLARAIDFAIARVGASKRLARLAHFDQLTGLANRTTFMERLQHAVEVSNRSGAGFAVMFIDMDRFKPINDTLGHHAGDILLQKVGRRLSNSVRAIDIVARLGGDEFALIIEGLQRHTPPTPVIRRITSALEQPFVLDGESVETTASMGMAFFPESADSAVGILRCADAAMYRSKKISGSHCELYCADPEGSCNNPNNVVAIEEQRVKSLLNQADLHLEYQPRWDLETQQAVSMQATLRWQRGDDSETDNDDLVPLLEASGHIIELGRWALDTACSQAAKNHKRGANQRVAIRVSRTQVEKGELVATVKDALDSSGLDPERLELEFHESVLTKGTRVITETLEDLRQLGVRIILHGFGTGYSSLVSLNHVQVDGLKLTRSLTKELDNPNGSALFGAIIDLAHNLDLEVIAEGVDRPEHLDFLKECGCDLIQGSAIADDGALSSQWQASKPVSADGAAQAA